MFKFDIWNTRTCIQHGIHLTLCDFDKNNFFHDFRIIKKAKNFERIKNCRLPKASYKGGNIQCTYFESR